MPILLGVEVSDDVYEANRHLAAPQPQPRTDARREVDRLQRERLENLFDAIWLRLAGDPEFWLRGYLFDEERGWHIDRYNETQRVGVEIHGGQFAKHGKSGHRNPAGMQRDWEKVNRCNELGIVLFGLTTAMVTVEHVENILNYVRR